MDDGRSGGIAGDGVLQSGEVTSSQFICNGQNGEDGQDGADGSDGADGADGQDGVDGRDGANALVDVETIEPGETCAAGGILVHTGIDDGRNGGVAGNGSLDEGEITSSRIICHGVDGKDGADGQNGSDGADGADGQDGANALVNVETIEPGETCAAGGVLIHSGIDDGRNEGIAGNDSLEQGEITSSQILCHGAAGQDGSDGADGANGVNALVSTEIVEPGEICAAGGVLIHTGIDDGRNDGIAGNDILEEGEITSSQVLCHGVDGRDGVDGIDGEDGVDGKDGASALVKAEAFGPGEECETGGLLIISGVDDGRLDGIANDGILQPGEITGSYVVCNGVDGQHGEDGSSGIDGRDGTDGASALVHTESIEPGDICLAGGIRIDAGTDDGSGEDGIAHDGTLQPGELLSSHVVCNGAPDTSEFEGGCGGCASPPLTSLTLLGLAMLRRRGR